MVENIASSEPVFPGGTETFLCTDIEGASQLLDRLRVEHKTLISGHHQVNRDALTKLNVCKKELQNDFGSQEPSK